VLAVRLIFRGVGANLTLNPVQTIYQPQQSVLKPHSGHRQTACMRYISAFPQRSQIMASSRQAVSVVGTGAPGPPAFAACGFGEAGCGTRPTGGSSGDPGGVGGMFVLAMPRIIGCIEPSSAA
jgi:hypothetical protein